MGIYERIQAATSAFFSGRGGGNSTYPLRFVPAQTSRFNWSHEAGDPRVNPIVAICLDFGMRCLQDVNFKVQRKTKGGKIDNLDGHPVLDLIEFPNPDDSRVDFLSRLYLDHLIEGTCFQFIANTRGGLPGELYWFDSRYVAPVFPLEGSKYLTAWKYTPAGTGRWKDYPQEKIIVSKKGVDPVNDRLGFSPVRAALKEIALTNLSSSYTCGIMKNSGSSTLVLSPPPGQEWSVDDARDIRISAQQRTSGDMAGTPLSFSVPVMAQGIGTTPQELMLTNIDASAVSRICASFGFDPMAVGLNSDNKTYSNLGESHVAAWKYGIKPVIKNFVIQWNHRIIKEFDRTGRLRIVPDYSEVEALAKDNDAAAKTASVCFEKGIWMQNEARMETEKEPIEGGDVFFYELTAAQAQQNAGDDPEEPSESDDEESDGADQDAENEDSEAA